MKKLIGYKFLVLIFAVGLFMMGLGAGICFFEFQSLAYCGEKTLGADGLVKSQTTLALPENGRVFYYEGLNVTVETDEAVEKGEAEITATAMGKAFPELGEPQYIFNRATERVSEQKYPFLDIYTDNAPNDYREMEAFKAMMYDIKERKLYSYNTPDMEVTIRVAAEDKDVFQAMPDNYGLLGSELTEEREKYDKVYYNGDMLYTVDNEN